MSKYSSLIYVNITTLGP